jgi:hypothetical protein
MTGEYPNASLGASFYLQFHDSTQHVYNSVRNMDVSISRTIQHQRLVTNHPWGAVPLRHTTSLMHEHMNAFLLPMTSGECYRRMNLCERSRDMVQD